MKSPLILKTLSLTALILTALLLFPARGALAQNSPPIADAGPDQAAFVGDSVLLQGSAMDPDGDLIVSWLWTIESEPSPGAGNIDDPTVPDSLFWGNATGDYVLALVVSDGMDWSAPDGVTIHVSENLPPTALALADVTSGPAPLTVIFDGSQSSDPEDQPLLFAWVFGDGEESTDESPTHTYMVPGVYSVNLTVKDDANQYDTDIITIVVTAPNNAPVASPTATPNTGCAPLVVQFAANAEDPDGDPLTYLWQFGDPASPYNESTMPDPIHVYESPGTYVAWLTVSDGQLDVSASVTIAVSSAIGLSVERAKVIFRREGSTRGKVKLVADFSAPMPQADDQVAIYFDGIELFDVPFSFFTQCLSNPDAYKYVALRTFVKINFSTMRIKVIRRGLNLTPLNNANGVDVELMMADSLALENIVLQPVDHLKLLYVRPLP